MKYQKEYEIKMKFLYLIDGIIDDDFEPMFKGINSFTIGLCKLEYIKNVFHIYLRRPGLLIGKKGRTIKEISKHLKVPITIHVVDLLKEN